MSRHCSTRSGNPGIPGSDPKFQAVIYLIYSANKNRVLSRKGQGDNSPTIYRLGQGHLQQSTSPVRDGPIIAQGIIAGTWNKIFTSPARGERKRKFRI